MSIPTLADLGGARILVTRPAHQADTLCRLIEEAGGVALRLPLIDIAASAPDTVLREQLSAAAAADGWIFTSANAARIATRLHPPPWSASVAAVGTATASTLSEAGVAEVLVPESEYSAAALLKLAPLQSVQGRYCVILTGEDGRSELAETLRARGAKVETLALYRRQSTQPPSDRVRDCVASCDAIVLTSGEGAVRLFEVTPEVSRVTLLQRTVLVPSPRVAEKVRQLGFTVPPLLPRQMTDSAMVQTLSDWWRTRKSAP